MGIKVSYLIESIPKDLYVCKMTIGQLVALVRNDMTKYCIASRGFSATTELFAVGV